MMGIVRTDDHGPAADREERKLRVESPGHKMGGKPRRCGPAIPIDAPSHPGDPHRQATNARGPRSP